MRLNRVCLLLGSNIEPNRYLPAAVRELGRVGRIESVSRVWQSAPIGDADQPDFCNVAVSLTTALDAEDLLANSGPLREIEARLDRVRDPGNKNAARTIDIDLCLFNADVRSVGDKRLPDPDLQTRACAAMPISELSGVELPGTPLRSLREVADQLRQVQPLTPRPDLDALVAAEWRRSRREDC